MELWLTGQCLRRIQQMAVPSPYASMEWMITSIWAPWMQRALECCKDHGGSFDDAAAGSTQDQNVTKKGAAGAWRSNFIYAPYIGNALTSMGIISSTFETSITWDRWPDFHRQVMEATQKAVNEICGQGMVACRFTHAYPDGPAPYYSILAPAKKESMIQQWEDIRAAASDVLILGRRRSEP